MSQAHGKTSGSLQASIDLTVEVSNQRRRMSPPRRTLRRVWFVTFVLQSCSLKIRRVEIISVAGGKLQAQGPARTVPPVTDDCVTKLQWKHLKR